jgi:citrate lyase beta subunit
MGAADDDSAAAQVDGRMIDGPRFESARRLRDQEETS